MPGRPRRHMLLFTGAPASNGGAAAAHSWPAPDHNGGGAAAATPASAHRPAIRVGDGAQPGARGGDGGSGDASSGVAPRWSSDHRNRLYGQARQGGPRGICLAPLASPQCSKVGMRLMARCNLVSVATDLCCRKYMELSCS